MPVPRLASRPSQGRHPIPWGVPRGFSWDSVTVQSLRVSDQFSLRHALPAQAYAPLRSPGAANNSDIDAIVEFKRRNPRVGCPRIAQEIARAFGIDIDKDIVRRVLAKHYRPEAGTDGPSWLSFIGHMKDSLWSVDLFRCESILLRSHCV